MKTLLQHLKPFVLLLLLTSPHTFAHDTWVQTNVLSVRTDEIVHVDLMLGNHGNDHRDFKVSSKISLPPWSLEVIDPEGNRSDIKPSVVDSGYAPKEGFWSARFLTKDAGIYQIIHSLDTLHGKTRALKTSKTYVVAQDDDAISRSQSSQPQFEFGKDLELVLLTPVTSLEKGHAIRVQVKHHSQTVANQRVTFIPRGATLTEAFDDRFERKSDANGIVEFTPPEANLLLVVAHRPVEGEAGEGFDKTHYSATLLLPIPNRPLRR